MTMLRFGFGLSCVVVGGRHGKIPCKEPPEKHGRVRQYFLFFLCKFYANILL